MIINRRDFIRIAGLGLAGVLIEDSVGQYVLGQSSQIGKVPLITEVEGVCRRLASHGWRDLLLSVTGGKLDLAASNLAAELAKQVASINRKTPGFEDFVVEGERGIEPGNPARSLLFHALASPAVVQGVVGKPLTDFPNPIELEAVENYVYGVKPTTIAELRARANNAELALVVFAPEYRTVSHTPHRQHADMVFSRTACSRVGNAEARYDGRRRDFSLIDESDPFAFRVMPVRFAPYIAMKVKGQKENFVPMRFKPDDEKRDFWVPLHKLFSGRECIAGLDLDVKLVAHFVNQKLHRFHKFMADKKLDTGWKEPDIDKHPFIIKDEMIADFSARREDGQGLIMPVPHPLFEKAEYKDRPLSFKVPSNYTDADVGVSRWFSGMQILPGDGEALFYEAYMDGLNRHLGRPAPEYINTRHELLDNGTEVDLNNDRNLLERVEKGGYKALHFIDYTADGLVAAQCEQLDGEIKQKLPAYAPVAPPDFFPAVTQRSLLEWWEQGPAAALRPGLWSIEPLALCDIRMAANIKLQPEKFSTSKFSIDDVTVTAIVSHPAARSAKTLQPPAGEPVPFTRLPDGSNGVFDPGWDVSQDRENDKLFLQNYGLGTPFIEDVKLCAALGSFWAAVVPDSTRTFQPGKRPESALWPWPTVIPLTDEEIGIVEVKGGGFYPWDGVRGPQIIKHKGADWVRYQNINYVDYTTLGGKMTAMLTSRIDLKEYQARALAMASVYYALGVRYKDFLDKYKDHPRAANRFQLNKSNWAVVSFRKLDAPTEESQAAEQQTGTKLRVGDTYRFHVYRHGKEEVAESNFQQVLVKMEKQAVFFVDGNSVLKKEEKDGKWKREKPILM